MKRFLIAMTALLTITMSVSAMSYEQARQQALFLTDKMAVCSALAHLSLGRKCELITSFSLNLVYSNSSTHKLKQL